MRLLYIHGINEDANGKDQLHALWRRLLIEASEKPDLFETADDRMVFYADILDDYRQAKTASPILTEIMGPVGSRAGADATETARAMRDILGCLVPAFDGALSSQEWRDALWARFYTGAPARLRQSVERYNIVKRA